MRESVPAFAIVRHDRWTEDIALAVRVIAVVPTVDEAIAEVERLSSLNADKDCLYFWTGTHWYPSGRGVVASE